MDYTKLDLVAELIAETEDPRALRSIAAEARRLGDLAGQKSMRLAELAGNCAYCFNPKNGKGRCPDNHCPGWLP